MLHLPNLTEAQTCLSCTHYLRCKDPEKSFMYSCDRFRQTAQSAKLSSRLFTDLLDTEIEDPFQTQERHRYEVVKSDFDIYSVIESVIHENTLAPPDLKINDRDFKQAPNFFTFTTSDQFLKVKPYLWQILYATILLAEYCPTCSDLKYFDNFKPDHSYGRFKKHIKLLEFGVCPCCGKNRFDHVKAGRLNFYDELAINAGQRSGKSAVVTFISTYLLHKMLKLQNPNEVYGLMSSNVLHGTFVALTFGQAKENLWDPFYGNVLESPWFQGYNSMLLHFSQRRGDEIVKLKDEFINYKHRRLLIYPASPDLRILRGRTRWLGAIDELGWFDNYAASNKVKVNATGTYAALGNSLRTVRSKAEKLMKRGFFDIPTAYLLNISSPSSVRDKIMELVKKSQGSRKMYGISKATWELNPEITRDTLAEEFRKDPVGAMRDYGAQPPLSSNPFIGNVGTVLQCQGEKRNGIELIYSRKRSPDGTHKRFAKVSRIRQGGSPSVLAIDAGYSNNSFAAAIAHLKDGIPCIDLLMEIQPKPGVPLSYRAIYDHAIKPIMENRNIQLVAADRWNSLKILSDIEADFECETVQYSLRYTDFVGIKEYFEDSEIILPRLPKGKTIDDVLAYDSSDYPNCFRDDPTGHLYLQLLTVQDTGSQVIKGDQLTDDLARAVMLAIALLIDEDYADLWSKEDIQIQQAISAQQMATARGASTGVFGGGGGGGNPGSSSGVLGRVVSRSG